MKATRTECVATLIATILFSLGMHSMGGIISITVFNQIVLLLIYIATAKSMSNLSKTDHVILLSSCTLWAIEICHCSLTCIKGASIFGAIVLVVNVLELATVYNKFIFENYTK